MSSLPPRIPTPTILMGGGGDNNGSPTKNNDLPPTSASAPSSRPGSRSASPSPFFGIVMPTPSFEKLLPNKVGHKRDLSSGSGSGPPAMPLDPNNNTNNNNKNLSRSRSADRSLKRRQSKPHTIQRQTTDELDTSGALCGGTAALAAGMGVAVGHCNPGLDDCHSNTMDNGTNYGGVDTIMGLSHTTTNGGLDCEGLVTRDNSLLASSTAERADGNSSGNLIEPYAVHHDEIVTALIDEALRNGNGGNGESNGSGNSGNSSPPITPTTNNAAELLPSVAPAAESKQGNGESLGDKSDSPKTTASAAPQPAATTASSSKHPNFKPRSPYRMKRGKASKLRKSLRSSSSNVGSGGDDTKKSSSSLVNNNGNNSTAVVGKASKSSMPVSNSLQAAAYNSSPTATAAVNTSNNNTNNREVADYLHPECILQKEKGNDKQQKLGFGMNNNFNGSSKQDAAKDNSGTSPSATGREATLQKLRQKLSMLGEIESGKFGRAAEMLRSDAVAFALQLGDSQLQSRQNLLLKSTHNNNNIRHVVTKVETRSILTLKMGFVSMSYGILLQWDCGTKLVELIVLRKMCRDDFLTPRDHGNLMSRSNRRDGSGAGSGGIGSGVGAGGGGGSSQPSAPSKGKPPLVPKKRTEKIAPPRVVDNLSTKRREAESAKGTNTKNKAGGTSSSAQDETNLSEKGALQRLSMLPHLPPNPLASITRFLTGVSASAGLTTSHNNNKQPKYFLSVSVLNVSQLHGVCDLCRNPNSVGRMMNGARLGALSKRKRKHPTIRPYIRFVLGKHEHCTKITKYNGGNPTWSKRHHNSCLLPCPPEELRWFAGREDLIVEVRNDWKHPGGGLGGVKASSGRLHHHHHRPLFGGGGGNSNSLNDQPILAAVTVPLSSVNIEDDDDGNGNNDNNDDNDKASPDQVAAAPARSDKSRGTWKHRMTKDGASSTNITIPLRMNCCRDAPMGSISLKITIKVPSTDEREKHAARTQQQQSSNSSLSKNMPSSLAKPNIQVETTFDGGMNGGEPKVSESIELGPLTRFMDGWSLGASARTPEQPVTTTVSSKENKKKETSDVVPTAAAAASNTKAKATKGNKKSNNSSTTKSGRRVLSPGRRRSITGGGSNNDKQPTKHKNLRWSKQFDHQSKKWSSFNSNKSRSHDDGGNSGGNDAAEGSLAPVTASPAPTSKKEEETRSGANNDDNGNNEGWFAFLSSGHGG